MAISKKMLVAFAGVFASLVMAFSTSMITEAANEISSIDEFKGGASAVLDHSTSSTTRVVVDTAKEISIENVMEEEAVQSSFVMANVMKTLNVRLEPSADSERVGLMYSDCGGEILEQRDGWTKLQSGSLIGWAKDEYLLFGDDALKYAETVGITLACIEADLMVRKEANVESEVFGILSEGDVLEVIQKDVEGWTCISYDGKKGYIATEYISFDYEVAFGETEEEIEIRKAEELEAKRHVKYAAYDYDEETLLLLAALIHCEARGETYEGQVAVGSVVMNRVRSSRYPNTVEEVIYQPSQFSPVKSGKVDKVLETGNINESCMKAAKEVLSGTSNMGDMLYFRRDDGREGYVLGNHVFY